MENLFITLVTRHRYPIWARYVGALVIVAIAFSLQIAMADQLRAAPLLLSVLSVFIAALIFDRGTGFFATFVSAGLVFYFLAEPSGSSSIETVNIIPLLLYVATGCAISAVTEALRNSVSKLSKAEAEKSLLLDELAHRTKNDLFMISSALNLQARSQSDPTAKAALLSAVTKVDVIARARDRLISSRDGDMVELSSYIDDLCHCLGDLLRDVRPIAVRVTADTIEVTSSQAVSIGLIVNELVTNAFKYAFPDESAGTIAVTLTRQGALLRVVVADNGIGCPPTSDRGLGSKLVQLLAAQLEGEVVQSSNTPGCRVTVTFPQRINLAA